MKKIGKSLCPNHEMSYICSIFVFLQIVCKSFRRRRVPLKRDDADYETEYRRLGIADGHNL